MAGELTLAEMVTDVRYALDNRRTITDAQLQRWLGWGLRHVSSPGVYRHRELEETTTITTVASDYDYAIPADLFGIYTVQNATIGYKLLPRDRRWMQERLRTSGRPSYYCLWGRQLIVLSTPDASNAGHSLVVDYWKRPAALASSGPASSLPPEWDEIIIQAAVWRAWVKLNRPERAVEARETLAGMVNEIAEATQIDGEDSGFQIQVGEPGSPYMR